MTPTAQTDASDTIKQIIHLARALKAPRITESATRLADHARDAGWTHETWPRRRPRTRSRRPQRLRRTTTIRAATMPHPKRSTTSTSNINPPPAHQSKLLTSGAYLTEHRNVVLLGPTGHRENTPGQRTGHRRLPPRPPRPIRHRHRMGRPTHRSPRPRTPTSRTGQTPPLPTHHRRRSRLPALRARSSEPVLPTRLITLRTRLPHTHQQPAIRLLGAACSATKSSPQQ